MPSPRLTIATIATESPMGAQGYQEQIARRAASSLLTVDPERQWTSRRLVVRSLRSGLPGNRRLPLGQVTRASASLRRQIGRALYVGDSVSHRMNLELPPAPGSDVVTLHDVVAWRFPDESSPVPAAIEELRGAEAVICVSEFTAQEAADLLGLTDVHVIHNGVDDVFFTAAPIGSTLRRTLGVDGPYILHSGGASERKNLAALAEAWPRIKRERPDLTLLMTGPPHPARTSLFQQLDGVVLAGRLADECMPSVVAGALAVVVPSRYEGFGLPALEGMAAGVTVVAANTSSLPEVIGNAGILVPPTAVGITEGVLLATSGDRGLDRLRQAGIERARGFSWDESAESHATLWASLAL